MIITFFGHSKIYNCADLASEIENTILNQIIKDEKITFYCGGYGDFDNLCAKVCKSIKQNGVHCEILLVIPYLPETGRTDIRCKIDSSFYDGSIYPPLERVPKRLAILKRNEWMIDKSDLIIGFVKHDYGGAYTALEYARRKGKNVINIAV